MIEIVDLTYFSGRGFEKLEEGEDGEWSIHLDGDGMITNKDPDREAPDEELFKGTQFLRAIYSELDTRLQFGVNEMVAAEVLLTPALYTMSDPDYTPEGEIYPQVPIDFEAEIPPDPSDERVADGPENPDEGVMTMRNEEPAPDPEEPTPEGEPEPEEPEGEEAPA